MPKPIPTANLTLRNSAGVDMLKLEILLLCNSRCRPKPINWAPALRAPVPRQKVPAIVSTQAHPTIARAQTNLLSQHSNMRLLFLLLGFIAAVYLSAGDLALSVSPGDSNIQTFRREALEAEGSGEFDRAESLYGKALAVARQSGAKSKAVEFISRIVQVRIENQKLLQTGALVKEAIQLTESIKNTPASDSTLTVWMNDMADAFYSKGEHTTREDIKEFCLRHYLDIKFAMTDTWDTNLMAKSNLLTSHLTSNGRYLEALPVMERSTTYFEMTQAQDIASVAWQYLALGTCYSAANLFDKAQAAFQKTARLQTQLGKSPQNEAALAKELGTLELEKGNLDAAREFYNRAFSFDQDDNRCLSLDEFGLGFVEERAANFDAAAQHYRACLHYHEKAKRPAANVFNPGDFDSVFVVAVEHLGKVLQQTQQNLGTMKFLNDKVLRLRIQHPEWLTKNPDSDKHFLIWWSLPTRFDLIGTRSDMPL